MPRVTEQNNSKSHNFSELSTSEMVRIINEEDKTVAFAVEEVIDQIAEAAELAAQNLRVGGRMFYFGAGTSGRLGIIDSSELPCTYGVEANLVQAIIAGGRSAVYDAAEGDEDSFETGFNEAKELGISSNDVVVGLAASGRTPYVLGAIEFGKNSGALTIGICNNKGAQLELSSEIGIAIETGAEVIEGSTRMKAGTSQKMVLNMLSTVIMTRLGYVYKNYMVRMVPNNTKLFERAIQIVGKCTSADEDSCKSALIESDWKIDFAIIMLLCKTDAHKAKSLLEENENSVSRVLANN